MLSFVSRFTEAKVTGVLDQAVGAMVRWDPATATLAELQTQEDALDVLGTKVSKARTTFNDDQKKLATIKALYNDRVTAAELLQKKAEAETDPAKKEALNRSLETIAKLAEESTAEIDQITAETKDAQDFLTMLEAAWTAKGDELRGAKVRLQSAARDQERASQQRGMAEERARSAKEVAGLSSHVSRVNTALSAMQGNAQKDREAADALNSKAKLLTPTDAEHGDPNIAAALAEAKGQVTGARSMADRLAALRTRE